MSDIPSEEAALWQLLATGDPGAQPGAAVRLGNLLLSRGDLEGAKKLYQRAIDSGDVEYGPKARVNLGVLLGRQGNLEAAKAAFQQVIISGNPAAAPRAAAALEELQRTTAQPTSPVGVPGAPAGYPSQPDFVTPPRPRMNDRTVSVWTIVLLVLFFPAGLVLMWVRAAWKTRTKWIVSAVFALFVIASQLSKPSTTNHVVTASTSKTTQAETKKTTTTAFLYNVPTTAPPLPVAPVTAAMPTTVPPPPAPTTAAPPPATVPPPPPPSPQDVLKAKLNKALGPTNRSVPRFASIDAQTGGPITVKWAIDENITNGLTKDTARIEAKDLLKAIRDSGFDYSHVTLIGTFPLQDVYGNAQEETVVTAGYDEATVNRINFDNIDSKNMFTIADSESVVPAFQY